MTIYLDGGGMARGVARRTALERFLGEARDRSGRAPHIAIVCPPPGQERTLHWHDALREAGAHRVTPTGTGPAGAIELTELTSADGILVPGGQASACLTALNPLAADVRRLVAEGVPYYGAGSGARIVSEAAVLSGSSIGGVPVAQESIPDGGGEVTMEQGLGLVDLTILTSAAQGTLALAVAAIEAGMTETILAIDEDAALVIGTGAIGMIGPGSAWHVRAGEQAVLVSSMRNDDAAQRPGQKETA